MSRSPNRSPRLGPSMDRSMSAFLPPPGLICRARGLPCALPGGSEPLADRPVTIGRFARQNPPQTTGLCTTGRAAKSGIPPPASQRGPADDAGGCAPNGQCLLAFQGTANRLSWEWNGLSRLVSLGLELGAPVDHQRPTRQRRLGRTAPAKARKAPPTPPGSAGEGHHPRTHGSTHGVPWPRCIGSGLQRMSRDGLARTGRGSHSCAQR